MKNEHSNFIEVKSCPVCSHSEGIFAKFPINYISYNLLKASGIENKPDITLMKCKYCKHHFASHTLKPEILDNYYSKLNSEIYNSKNSDPIDTSKKSRLNTYSIIEKAKPEGGKILDVGCGYGFLLSYMNTEKWERYGIEPSPYASTIAKNKGIEILGKYIEEISDSAQMFDVIVLTDLIEHIENAKPLLTIIKQHLKPNGIIVIETGNIGSLNARIAGTHWVYFSSFEHICFYSKSSIQYLLKQEGYTNTKVVHISHYPGILSNLYKFFKNLAMLIIFTLLRYKKPFYMYLVFDHMVVIAKK